MRVGSHTDLHGSSRRARNDGAQDARLESHTLALRLVKNWDCTDFGLCFLARCSHCDGEVGYRLDLGGFVDPIRSPAAPLRAIYYVINSTVTTRNIQETKRSEGLFIIH
jgi:hypothetical protein